MTINRKNLLLFYVLAIFTAAPLSVYAAGFAETPCDYDGYFESLKARAWMEAQREMTQNQNLIHKPDSVLQYSCFDGFARQLALNASFSEESVRWGSVKGRSEIKKTMDTALSNSVGVPAKQYLKSFEHEGSLAALGGGRGPTDPTPFKNENPAVNDYNCGTMNAVWQKAQCGNFNQNPTTDGFLTFEQFGKESRHFGSCTGEDKITEAWKQQNKIALGGEDDTPWTEDNAKAYTEELGADGCAGSTAIPTGVTIRRIKERPPRFLEKICVKPGCSWVPTGIGTGSCEES